MTTFLIIVGIIALLGVAVMLSAVYIGSKSDELSDKIMLDEWRKGLQRNDIVRIDGIVWRIESIDGKVAEVTNFNDQTFVLLTDCYPVD